MRLALRFYLLFILIQSFPVFGQNDTYLRITKVNGTYHKSIKLPANLRIVNQEEEYIKFRLDSIRNGIFYGNNDSIPLSEIKVIHLRGVKEFIKYTSLTACVAITFGATYFTIYAFNYPVVLDGGNEIYKYLGLGYMTTFSALGTSIYLYPRTRFNVLRYSFQTN